MDNKYFEVLYSKYQDAVQRYVFYKILPEIKISKSKNEIFNMNFEELPGWFIIPQVGEKISWAIYDYPQTANLSQKVITGII